MTTYPTGSLHPHPQADIVPWADADAHAALMADIEKHGIQVPVDALPDGTVLDGRTRLAIAKVLSIPEVPVRWVEPADPVAYMVRMAVMRRHLSPATCKALAARMLRDDPSRSDRSVAKAAGIDHKTVGTIRAEAEGRGEIPHVAERTDSLGRQQPATKPERAPEPTPDEAAWEDALSDPATVEALDRGIADAEAGRTVPMPRPASRPTDLPVTDAHRERFPQLAASELSRDLADAIAAVRTVRLDPKAWAERVPQMRGEDLAALRSKVANVHRWADEWDALLAPRPLSIVGGSK